MSSIDYGKDWLQGVLGPFPNCYRVPDSRIIAGEYPDDQDTTMTREKINALLDAGAERFVDLTEEGELEPYESQLRDEAQIRGVHVSYIRLPIRDLRVPTLDEMSRVQSVLADAERLGKIVYVHCWGGVGRTGTVVGCHLVERGHSSDEALGIVQRLFQQMSPEKVQNHPNGSPETDAQREFVRRWARKRPNTVDPNAPAD